MNDAVKDRADGLRFRFASTKSNQENKYKTRNHKMRSKRCNREFRVDAKSMLHGRLSNQSIEEPSFKNTESRRYYGTFFDSQITFQKSQTRETFHIEHECDLDRFTNF